MNNELITIPYEKSCVLRLLPSEIKPYLPMEVVSVGLKRGKAYRRTENAYKYASTVHADPAESMANDVEKYEARLLAEKQKEAARQPYKGNKPYRSH